MYNFKIKLNEENLIHNYEYLKNSKQKEILAVLKANAYGHGIEPIAKILSKNGCSYFVVARLYEALKIFNLKLSNVKVLVLESIENFEDVLENENLELAVNSYQDLNRYLSNGIKPNRLHIKLEFGFSRNGIEIEKLEELVRIINQEHITFKGIFTHIFAANYEDSLTLEKNFREVVSKVGVENFEIIHLQNSAGILMIENDISTHLRCGILLYGLQELGFYDENLKQVFSLEGEVGGINQIEGKKYIGYDLQKDLQMDEYKYIAKIKLGYGDGFSKKNCNSKCIINNKEFRIVQVSMDTTFVAVDSSVKVGDKVSIFKDLKVASSHLEMPPYEFIPMINERIPRVIGFKN
ncbi:alanine racemase [Cetobacterium sp. 2A]|uniref:alanine racemase n=1 Tax=unclassified Cetobacterium TaxID=2630983 RepID=UPI00163CB7E0|nr:alanine racemase [Cetobacterium sp. 2A]MBC2857382.1 alanine racemase [Cetobacterium sp. 2A]